MSKPKDKSRSTIETPVTNPARNINMVIVNNGIVTCTNDLMEARTEAVERIIRSTKGAIFDSMCETIEAILETAYESPRVHFMRALCEHGLGDFQLTVHIPAVSTDPNPEPRASVFGVRVATTAARLQLVWCSASTRHSTFCSINNESYLWSPLSSQADVDIATKAFAEAIRYNVRALKGA